MHALVTVLVDMPARRQHFLGVMAERFPLALALLHPGAHGIVGVPLAFSSWAAYGLEEAGFEVRDRLAHLVPRGSERIDWWLVRKPLAGSVADTVLTYGTGALNIDAARVGYQSEADRAGARPQGLATSGGLVGMPGSEERQGFEVAETSGRWPSNLLLSHGQGCGASCSPGCPVAALNEQSGDRPGGVFPPNQKTGTGISMRGAWTGDVGPAREMGDTGGAARYFQTFGAGQWVEVVRYLCRLITPPGGLVLDPLGHPTVREAVVAEGLRWTRGAASEPG